MKSWEPIPARCYGPQDRGLKSAWSNVRLACNAFAIWPGGILAWIKKLPLGCGDIQLLSLGPNTTLDSICFHVPNVNNLANVDSSSGLLKPSQPRPTAQLTRMLEMIDPWFSGLYLEWGSDHGQFGKNMLKIPTASLVPSWEESLISQLYSILFHILWLYSFMEKRIKSLVACSSSWIYSKEKNQATK